MNLPLSLLVAKRQLQNQPHPKEWSAVINLQLGDAKEQK